MKILAIDPGSEQSGFVVFDSTTGRIDHADKINNEFFLGPNGLIRKNQFERVVIEMVSSYGKPVGAEVFETCVWIGRLMEQRWEHQVARLTRRQVKKLIGLPPTAKDKDVRRKVIDHYSSDESISIGTKASPGPLFGISKDMWAALALALAYCEDVGLRPGA